LVTLDGVDRRGDEQEIAGTESEEACRQFFQRVAAGLGLGAQAGSLR
jgi:hypothetical protein